ncbi:MAG: sulfotransferase family protein [Candidatus Marinimicrobia bacterium]|nr:sulfotransferase family protein [Candidatus Neomarinimicrobiota bacterium]
MRKITKLRSYLKLFGKKLLGYRKRWNYTNGRIRHEQNIIFIHIPKTAGNSITAALAKADPVCNKNRKRSPKIAKHAKAFEIRCLLGEKIWNKYFTFSFVRNPWDLMVSSFNWWRQKGKQRLERFARAADKIESMDFEQFMHSRYGRFMINERYGNYHDWLTEQGNLIVDYIGKVEDIDQDWKKICQINNLDYIEMPHKNKSKRSSYRNYYNSETRQIVRERFKWGIERFNYSF